MRPKISLKHLSRFIAFFLTGLAVVISSAPAPIGAANAVGLSQGKLNAEPSGGASYQMPIVVSPGTAGIQPKLAFQYSSGGRNGALGMGWSVSGVSAITRAPQTLAQDGAIHGVDMTLADRYSMDGQRLIALVGTDGYAGTEYRTELNSFTKVISNGASGNGPATFTAWTKSGLIYTFGGGNGASFIPAGRADGTILTWLLSKVQDQTGNYMTFQYSSEGNLASVNYTMNDGAGLGSYASIVFTYDTTRPDPAIGYVAGSPISMTQRLSRVTSYYGSTIVRQYDLAYQVSSTTQKSRLISITEGTGSQTYPPTQFTWDNNTNSISLTPSLGGDPQKDNTQWTQGDFVGDGTCQMARMRDNVIKIYRVSDFNNPIITYTSTSGNFDATQDVWLQGDFSGDGKLDLVRVHGENNTQGNPVAFRMFVNTGTSFTQPPTQHPGGPVFYSSRVYMAMDVNGDGKLDIVCINGVDPKDGKSQATNIWVYLNNGNGTFTVQQWGYTSVDGSGTTAPGSDNCAQTDRWLVGDFNGDGLPDLAKVWENNGKNSVRIYLNQNGSYRAANRIFKSGTFYGGNNNTQPPAYIWLTGDFNGDGLADLIRIPKAANVDGANTADVFLSTGSVSTSAPPTFTAAQPWLSLLVGEQAKIQTGDYNADGRTDLVILKDHVKGSSAATATDMMGATINPPAVDLSSVSGLVVFQDDPVMTAIDAAQAATAPTTGPSPPPPSLVPLITYPGQSEAEAAWGTASSTAATASSTSYTYSCQRAVYLSNGGGFYLQTFGDDPVMDVTSYSTPKFQRWFTADFNGDGKEDLVRKFITTDSSGQRYAWFNVYASSYGYQDLMRTVTDGMGSTTAIDYEPLTGVNGVNVFTKSSDAVPPAIDLIEPMPVVASITYDNGLGGTGQGNTYSVSYRYEGLKADPQRGMLGFRAVEAIDYRPVSGQSSDVRIRTKSWLKQGFPFTGMAERTITYLGDGNPADTQGFNNNSVAYFSGLLSLTTTLYAAGPTENQNTHVYFPYAQDSHVYSWDLNSAATNDTETIVQQIDAYGNTGTSVVKTKDLPSSNYFVKTTTSNYNISTSNWRIGQVTSSSVLSQAPGQPNITRTSGFGYNSGNGEVGTETVEPGGPSYVQTDYQFDAFGNTKVSTTSGNDMSPANTTRATTTNYDVRGRFVATTINALGQTETKAYDQRFGGVTSVTGPNGLTDTASYDDFSRKVLSTRADGTNTVTSYEWIASNNNAPNAPANSMYLVRVTPDDGPQAITYFDRLGREMRKETIAGNGKTEFVDTTYDYRGRKKTVTKPYFKGDSPTVATTFYDGLDRVVQLQVPSVDETGASVMTYTTSAYNGLVVTMTNPKGQQTTTTKDAAGHLRQVKDALNGTITYTYDALGELTQTVDAAGNTTTIQYDVRGRKTSVNDPDLGPWSYHYFSTGELKDQTDANGNVVSFKYDKLGRMIERDEPAGDVTTWTYDYYTDTNRGTGKLRSVQFTPHTGSQLAPYSNMISYDNLGRVTQQVATIAGTPYYTSTGYDQFSRPRFLAYPSGFAAYYLYDVNGYLKQVTNAGATTVYWQARDYDADGHVTEEQYGNGIITDRVYIPQNGLLQTIKSGIGTNTNVQNLEYHFDVLGNLKIRKDNNQTISGNTLTETFGYDALNRLTNAQVTGQAQQNYTYNILGNITHKDGVGDYAYPAAGAAHPHAVLSAGSSGTASYDANGNMLSGFQRSMTWTWFNQPQQITGYGAVAYFEYDTDHQRVYQRASTSNGLVVTTYVGGFFEAVDDGNTVKYKNYISAPVGRVAIYTSTYNLHTYAWTYDTKYCHRDHLGSVDVLTNESGGVIERDSFDAWGFRRTTDWQSQRPIGSTSIISRGFTDHEELDALGLVNMNGRIYDPGIGRFLSADPFVQAPTQTQNFNRYSYVLNNPLSFSDPSGFNFLQDFGSWLNHTFGSTGAQIFIGISAVICIAAQQYYFAPMLATLIPATAANVVVGVAAGFTSSFVSTSVSGAALGQAFESGLISAGTAALTAGVVGPQLEGIDASTPLGFAEKTLGHGIAGGLLNAADAKLQNGSFRDGFLSGFASEAASVGINMVPGRGFESVATRVVLSAAVGGTAAELGGGKFANGAITAAFLRLYNEERSIQEVDRLRREAADAARAPEERVDRIVVLATNHVGGPYDTAHNPLYINDTFNVDGTIMTAHEFGNYIAGYASYASLGESGVTFMHIGGDLLHLKNYLTFDDPNSFRLIEEGANDSYRDYGFQPSWRPIPKPFIIEPLRFEPLWR